MNASVEDAMNRLFAKAEATQMTKPTGQLVGKDEIVRFLLAGAAIFTLKQVNVDKPRHYTYRVSKAKSNPSFKSANPARKVEFFVGLLTGPDNTGSYSYMGLLRRDLNREIPLHFETSEKFKGDPDSSRFFEQFFIAVTEYGQMPANLEFYHAGACCRCGRTLTDPTSIELGIGPECRAKMGV